MITYRILTNRKVWINAGLEACNRSSITLTKEEHEHICRRAWKYKCERNRSNKYVLEDEEGYQRFFNDYVIEAPLYEDMLLIQWWNEGNPGNKHLTIAYREYDENDEQTGEWYTDFKDGVGFILHNSLVVFGNDIKRDYRDYIEVDEDEEAYTKNNQI